ncbi:hypothetical protein B0H19DRAFT_375233 [Mycena capillaripes]|nr:hypothetical protein B0H19DRAFT_375233 [Mycena capillaripes]
MFSISVPLVSEPLKVALRFMHGEGIQARNIVLSFVGGRSTCPLFGLRVNSAYCLMLSFGLNRGLVSIETLWTAFLFTDVTLIVLSFIIPARVQSANKDRRIRINLYLPPFRHRLDLTVSCIIFRTTPRVPVTTVTSRQERCRRSSRAAPSAHLHKDNKEGPCPLLFPARPISFFSLQPRWPEKVSNHALSIL